MRSVKRPLNWLLLGIALVSVAAILSGQESPFVRAAVCVQMTCPKVADSHAWEKIAYDLGKRDALELDASRTLRTRRNQVAPTTFVLIILRSSVERNFVSDVPKNGGYMNAEVRGNQVVGLRLHTS
jgi:hypothetical protein